MKTKRDIDIAEYDEIILEMNALVKAKPEEVRQSVVKQLKDDGVAILPFGVTAKTVKRFKCVVKGELNEKIH